MMMQRELLQAIKQGLAEHYGGRLRGVVLFGSEARGDADPESDVDMLVLLEGPVDRSTELEAIIGCVYPIQLEREFYRPIQALPVDVAKYEARSQPLYEVVHEEGVQL